MQVTNLTNDTIGVAGVTIPKRQTRNVRDWDRVKDTRRVRELLESGSISVPTSYVTGSEAEDYENIEPEEQPKRGFLGYLRDDEGERDD